MARISRSLINLQGTLGDLTIVNSQAYGRHVRARKGTHTKVECNDSLKLNSGNALSVTSLASVWQNALRSIELYFVQPRLWEKIIGRMFATRSSTVSTLLHSLEGLDINAAYPFERLLPNLPEIEWKTTARNIIATMHCDSYPIFPTSLHADSYFYTLHIFWLNETGIRCETSSIETEWLPLKHEPLLFTLKLSKPSWAAHYTALLKLHAGTNNTDLPFLPAQGMKVIKCAEASR